MISRRLFLGGLAASLGAKVWPNVLALPKGVDLQALRRADGHLAAAALFRGLRRAPVVSLEVYEGHPRTPGSR